jgi:BirA family biotin operon repressor/biotin-[acetyl-CoA-carboxylase] ligase
LPGVEWQDETVSTSDRVKALARAGAPEWTTVLAERQSGGRGREGRAWASPPGGLYLSVLLRPRFERVGLLPLAAGVAVAEAAEGLGVRVELKWPNDVLASGRKLAGILAEAASGSGGVEWVVLGVGLNVALDAAALPPGLAGAATSLRAEGVADPSVADVAASVLERLGVWYDALGSGPARVVSAWRSRSVAWWGGQVEVRTGDGGLEGRLVEVDDDGALVVEVGGRRRRLLSGEVRRLRPGTGGREPCF